MPFQTLGDLELERMLDAAANFASSLNFTEPYWLTLAGQSGCGKTTLARAVFKQFMRENRFELHLDRANQHIYGNTGTFCDWRRLCDDVRSGDFGRSDDLCREWFVVIDDLGAERDPTGFIASITDRILNARLRKWTLITTNLPLAEIASRMDPRIASRMLRNGSVVVESKAGDYTLRANK